MRRLLVAAILLAALAGTAAAETERADVRGRCSSKSIDIDYWPQGHPSLPAIGFPAFGPAHAEFYKGHDVKATKREVRRVIRTTVTLGNLGSVGQAGATAAVAEVRLSNPPGKSSLQWDARACSTVDVGG